MNKTIYRLNAIVNNNRMVVFPMLHCLVVLNSDESMEFFSGVQKEPPGGHSQDIGIHESVQQIFR